MCLSVTIVGLEPTNLSAFDPESRAFTNFAILLFVMLFRHYAFLFISDYLFTTDDPCSATELRPHFGFILCGGEKIRTSALSHTISNQKQHKNTFRLTL